MNIRNRNHSELFVKWWYLEDRLLDMPWQFQCTYSWHAKNSPHLDHEFKILMVCLLPCIWQLVACIVTSISIVNYLVLTTTNYRLYSCSTAWMHVLDFFQVFFECMINRCLDDITNMQIRWIFSPRDSNWIFRWWL